MNRRILRTLVLTAVSTLLFAGAAAGGEWEDEFPIIQDPVLQYRSYIATGPDDTVYVLWPDWTNWEDTKVMLTRSTDKGHTWIGPEIIFEGLAYDDMDIAADTDGVHLLLVEFYEDEVSEYKLLYYAKSTDGGVTFSTPVRVGERQNIEFIELFTSPGYIFIYAQNMDWDLDEAFNYLYISTDGGVSWTERRVLPEYALRNASFTVKDGVIHLVYAGMPGSSAIVYSSSTDVGITWSPPTAVSSGEGPHSQLPQVAVDDEAIHIAWEDDRNECFNVMYSRSTDGGASWSRDRRLNDTFYGARNKLLVDEEGLHIVWCQYHGDDGWPSSWGSFDYGIIWYKFSDDSGLNWSDEFRVSQNEDIPPIDLPDRGANVVQLAEYVTGFCAMWQDKRDGNIDLYMRNNLGPACSGDVDGDGDTDLSDLAALLAACGTSEGEPDYDPNADLDGNGTVDLTDLAYLLSDYGCGS